MQRTLARLRVPLGFVCAAAAFSLARPTGASLARGLAVAMVGEALRIWAAGHIDKGREVTTTGPYQLVRHPLYLGSAIMAAGFVIAARSAVVAAIVSVYMLVTLLAAMRTEEAALEARFGAEYASYRAGAAPRADRAFSLARVRANREYRAIGGLAAGMAILYFKIWFRV